MSRTSSHAVRARGRVGVAAARWPAELPARYADLYAAHVLDAIDDALDRSAESGYPLTAAHVEKIQAYVAEKMASGGP